MKSRSTISSRICKYSCLYDESISVNRDELLLLEISGGQSTPVAVVGSGGGSDGAGAGARHDGGCHTGPTRVAATVVEIHIKLAATVLAAMVAMAVPGWRAQAVAAAVLSAACHGLSVAGRRSASPQRPAPMAATAMARWLWRRSSPPGRFRFDLSVLSDGFVSKQRLARRCGLCFLTVLRTGHCPLRQLCRSSVVDSWFRGYRQWPQQCAGPGP